MRGVIINTAKKVFEESNGYAGAKDLIRSGIGRNYIAAMEKDGMIKRVKRGVYLWNDNCERVVEDDYSLISKAVPRGVMCLLSALVYYGFSNYIPDEYNVAIERTYSRPVVPECLPVKLVFFSKSNYEQGITEAMIDSNKFKIYDIEKTICDCIRYRNKIGTSIVNEAVRKYLKRKDKNIEKLIHYSRVCRIEKVLDNYMEMLIL